MPDPLLINPASIFNDVLGPVMTGPSSSHTAGPARIGKAVRLLAGDDIAHAQILFKEDGSYPAAYREQSTDKGFIGGLLGLDPGHEQLCRALDLAHEQGLEYVFSTEPNTHPHPNTARIRVRTVSGRALECLTLSTGGGMFEILEVNGHAVSIHGDFYEFIIQGADEARLDQLCDAARAAGARIHREPGAGFARFTSEQPLPEDVAALARTLCEQGAEIFSMDLVLPVGGRFRYDMPFMTAREALVWAAQQDAGPGMAALEPALAYEQARSGHSREQILARMQDIVNTMRNSADTGLRGGLPVKGYLQPKAARMAEALPQTRVADIGILNQCMLMATAIMECNSAGGIVVASPTAGSCGVLPAVVLALGSSLSSSEEEVAGAMLTAGLVGVFIAHQATFAAEVCACQAEVGSATAMAAAAAVQLLGGSAEQAFAAAALALQNVLGLICDPVAGFVEIPCVNRNSMGAANALTSANMVLCGFDPVIPLDEVIETMRSVGGMLPSTLRCTNSGGLCLTPTARAIHQQLQNRK
jgi:L-serine dehydratase